tara:strand:- start:822 stop:1142 length:321 start_codon:yes stop_codon:yes gene_type:complete
MATVSSTFGAADVSASLRTGAAGENVTVALSGTYAASVQLERAMTPDATSWEKVMPRDNSTWNTANATVSEVYQTRSNNEVLRLRALTYTSGTVTYSITDAAKVID